MNKKVLCRRYMVSGGGQTKIVMRSNHGWGQEGGIKVFSRGINTAQAIIMVREKKGYGFRNGGGRLLELERVVLRTICCEDRSSEGVGENKIEEIDGTEA